MNKCAVNRNLESIREIAWKSYHRYHSSVILVYVLIFFTKIQEIPRCKKTFDVFMFLRFNCVFCTLCLNPFAGCEYISALSVDGSKVSVSSRIKSRLSSLSRVRLCPAPGESRESQPVKKPVLSELLRVTLERRAQERRPGLWGEYR